ncbi:MAG: mannose-6-phosphate isomerase, class I [Treponema sp.]|jgi:mannose-6-phosphate isomerase|nr:mannose-6-phosphate isomerase, class I [Treponema sp.]
MAPFFKLQNVIKHYDWGSPEWIPGLLGKPNTGGLPWAELWMGVHPGGPSVVKDGGETLAALIEQNPSYLGREILDEFGALPYLFKLLAVAKPLSIQVHPGLDQARKGWERENKLGIPLSGANRNYKDPNHKPEILCALSPFTAMCGFRPLPEISLLCKLFFSRASPSLAGILPRLLSRLLPGFLPSPAEPDNPALSQNPAGVLRNFLQTLLGLSGEYRRALGQYAREAREGLTREYGEYREIWDLCAFFGELYPEDPAVISPLYLNLIHLAAGEAVYLPPGVLHAYIRGFGVELMANSDNVLRGGLTPKHIDPGELLRILNFSAEGPVIIRPSMAGDDPRCSFFQYPAPCREFSLSVLQSRNGRGSIPEKGPLILIVTEGQAALSGDDRGETMLLDQGEAAFIPAREGGPPLSFSGTYTLYAAGPGSGVSGP